MPINHLFNIKIVWCNFQIMDAQETECHEQCNYHWGCFWHSYFICYLCFYSWWDNNRGLTSTPEQINKLYLYISFFIGQGVILIPPIYFLTIKEQPEVDITTNPNTAILHSVRMGFLLYTHKGHKCNLDFYIFHSCKSCLSPICFGRAIIASTLFTNFYFYDFIITISHLFFERNTTM